MLMVLFLHLFSAPLDELAPSNRAFIITTRGFCIAAVNIFVLISGWFSIRPSAKGFTNFLFQCLWFAFLPFIITALFIRPVTLSEFPSLIFVGRYHWFVTAYMALYIVSPLLNLYCEKATSRQLLSTVAALLVMQTLYGWCINIHSFSGGYSAFSFMTLYLLARWLRLHCPEIPKPKVSLAVFVASSLAICALLSINGTTFKYASKYTDPLVILSAVAALLLFARIKIPTSKIINRLAASAFAVYLFQEGIGIYNIYHGLGADIQLTHSGAANILLLTALVAAFYCAGIILDQPRIFLWNRFGTRLTSSAEKLWNRFIAILY